MRTIGITGHRRNRLSAATCEALVHIFQEKFATFQGPHRIMTGMADGADLMACRASPKNWKILGLLAEPYDSFLDYLARASLQDKNVLETLARTDVTAFEFMPAPHPNYHAVSAKLIERSDHLLAVWDGFDGKPAGTGYSVKSAYRAGIAVEFIQPDALHEGWKYYWPK